MKYFKISYKVGKKKDTIVLSAKSKIDAIEQFYQMQLGVLLNITQVSKPIDKYIQEIKEKYTNPIKNKPADLEKLIAFFEQVTVMLDAGLPLNMVLAEVLKTQDDKMIKAIFSNILSDIESGKGFYDAALQYKTQLGYLSVSMIKMGEETGELVKSLEHLITILQDISENRKKFKKATRYPIVVIFAMMIAFTIVIIFVIPQFKTFFLSSHMQLPLPTRFLLWIEGAVTNYGVFIILSGVGIFSFVAYLYAKSQKAKYIMDKYLLKIMIIGKATLYAMISRFVYIFSVLVEAGIPMMEALQISSEIVENSYIKGELDKIPVAIEEGRSLYTGFQDSKMFENMVCEMIKAGEMGGGLDKMLVKVAKIYKDRFDYIVDNISTLIEPILIAAIAGFVLTLALGIFLPMWSMTDVAG